MSDDPTTRIAQDLREVRRLSLWLDEQAQHKASDRLMPGGHALVEASPVSRVSRLDAIEFIERWNSDHYGEPCQVDMSHLNDEGYETSLTSLLFWSDDWRERTGSTKARRPTIAGEASWLASALDWAVDNEPEPHLDDFARDVRQARGRLENILYAGARAERTRVPCIECGSKLLKIYADLAKYDHWRCPDAMCPQTTYDKDEFKRARHAQLHAEGAERYVLVPDAIAAVKPRPEHTVRTWIRRMEVRRICDIATRQVMVFWPDVRDKDAEARRRAAGRRKRIA